MKKILGLDLGTNSIGWALVNIDPLDEKKEIIALNSRIIPMGANVLRDFNAGVSISQTAERTKYRSIRRLYQRDNLRRERLHRVLNILGFLPQHYANEIDFEKRFGQFKENKEPKLNYKKGEDGKHNFIFMDSFQEMVKEFEQKKQSTKIPLDWTLYYLRKKALSQKIKKEELAWILLNFNQKRGYYQLRGDEADEEDKKNRKKVCSLKIIEVQKDNESKDFYSMVLENKLTYSRKSKEPLYDWKGKTKEFIITTQLDKDGKEKTDKKGKVKYTLKLIDPETDWLFIKSKTEKEVEDSGNTVGQYIYKTLLKSPTQKIKGKLVRTIERDFYKDELERILNTQYKYHSELKSDKLYNKCLEELYPRNENHKNNLKKKGFVHLFLEDIIFYQRPLKTKKSTISECPYESRSFKDSETGETITKKIKAIPKSHPLFQEFRLWQFLGNLKIYHTNPKNIDVTKILIPDEDAKIEIFDFLKSRKEVEEKNIIKYFIDKKLIKKEDKEDYRWNYVRDEKKYPANETYAQFLSRLKKIKGIDAASFLTQEKEIALWHIIYSVKDRIEYKKALKTYAIKYKIDKDSFVENFLKFPVFQSDYGAYSEKAIKKLLSVMRIGKYWAKNSISDKVKMQSEKITERLEAYKKLEAHKKEENKFEDIADDDIPKQVIKSFYNYDSTPLSGLNTYQACYLVYKRHSEVGGIKNWKKPEDINTYLKNFKQHSLRNPIVEQVVKETLRTVHDIWNYYGKGKENFFDEIHVELGREIKSNAKKRKQILDQNNENENTNQRLRKLLSELKNDTTIDGNINSNSLPQQEKLKLYEEGIYQNPEADYKKVSKEKIDKIRKNISSNKESKEDINKYKLWLEQGYCSPYTGKIIPLHELFTTNYQIEHIIPQSRYFDNSLSNKVICESEVNKLKDNRTAYEFLKEESGSIVELSNKRNVTLFTLDVYERHCEKHFKTNKTKLKKLMSEDIPEGFINRQLNDTRYISKLVTSLLSNIVREDSEREATSKHLITTVGSITSDLKKDWGLNDKWNEIITPRFKRLNKKEKTEEFGFWDKKINAFRCSMPDKKGANKKRIDHRHHALDALIVACTTKSHVNYISSLSNTESKTAFYQNIGYEKKIKSEGKFCLPWKAFPTDAKNKLQKAVVTFKQNLRVINKTNNKTWQWTNVDNKLKKKLVRQTKGDNWAIRKSLHKESVSGKVNIKTYKEISFSSGLKDWKNLVDNTLKNKIKKLYTEGKNQKEVVKYFKNNPYKRGHTEIKNVKVYITKEATAIRIKLTKKLTQKQLDKITDSGIRKIFENHLKNPNYIDKEGKKCFDLAFSDNGIEEMNRNIKNLNGGKQHHPIYNIRIYEEGNKFKVGYKGNNKSKYVEAAKGTNLFFAIYWNKEKNKRTFETIPLNIVIEHQKQESDIPKKQRIPIPLNDEKGKFLFYLSPNDLVYIPTKEEEDNPNLFNFKKLTEQQVMRIYKMVDASKDSCLFRPFYNAKGITENEGGQENKSGRLLDFYDENTIYDEKEEPVMIKEACWKIKTDRLGNITKVYK